MKMNRVLNIKFRIWIKLNPPFSGQESDLYKSAICEN